MFKGFSLLCRGTYLNQHPGMSACNFFFWATILQYKQLKISKFTFLMNLIMKSKKSNVLYYGQAVFYWVDLIWCIFYSASLYRFFYNNKYIIVSSLTIGGTDMGICSFKKRSIKIRVQEKVQERNCIECVSVFLST